MVLRGPYGGLGIKPERALYYLSSPKLNSWILWGLRIACGYEDIFRNSEIGCFLGPFTCANVHFGEQCLTYKFLSRDRIKHLVSLGLCVFDFGRGDTPSGAQGTIHGVKIWTGLSCMLNQCFNPCTICLSQNLKSSCGLCYMFCCCYYFGRTILHTTTKKRGSICRPVTILLSLGLLFHFLKAYRSTHWAFYL